ncbi:MAG: phytanoyl-CoA dioxygenase family protein [Nanoarchaeota archaeon]|nr:phytanoyl-CoA dioxygenase family protein [Nanoarchaeota archaeon]
MLQLSTWKPGQAREATKEEKEFYEENGYIVLKGVYSSEECDEIFAVIERHADHDFAAIMNPHRSEFLRALDPRPNNFRINSQIAESSNFLSELMKDPRIVAVLESLQGNILDGVMSQIIFKEAGSNYASQGWNPHQDNAYTRNKNGLYITTNLFLEKALFENGTMYLYPGSHKEGLLPSEHKRSFREDKGTNPGNTVEIPEKHKGKDKLINFDKGDVLVLHGNVIHGSYPNISKILSRPLYMNTYLPPGEDYNPGVIAKRERMKLH